MFGFTLVALILTGIIGYGIYLDSRPDSQNASTRANLGSPTARFDAQASRFDTAQIASIAADVAVTKADVGYIKTDVGEIKSSVKQLQDNMETLIEDVKLKTANNPDVSFGNLDHPTPSVGTTLPPIGGDQPNWQEISDEITAHHTSLKNGGLVQGKNYILDGRNGDINILTPSKEATHIIEDKLTDRHQPTQKVRRQPYYGSSTAPRGYVAGDGHEPWNRPSPTDNDVARQLNRQELARTY